MMGPPRIGSSQRHVDVAQGDVDAELDLGVGIVVGLAAADVARAAGQLGARAGEADAHPAAVVRVQAGGLGLLEQRRPGVVDADPAGREADRAARVAGDGRDGRRELLDVQPVEQSGRASSARAPRASTRAVRRRRSARRGATGRPPRDGARRRSRSARRGRRSCGRGRAARCRAGRPTARAAPGAARARRRRRSAGTRSRRPGTGRWSGSSQSVPSIDSTGVMPLPPLMSRIRSGRLFGQGEACRRQARDRAPGPGRAFACSHCGDQAAGVRLDGELEPAVGAVAGSCSANSTACAARRRSRRSPARTGRRGTPCHRRVGRTVSAIVSGVVRRTSTTWPRSSRTVSSGLISSR